MTQSGGSDASPAPTIGGDREWYLACSYRFGSELWLDFEETAREGEINVRVRRAGKPELSQPVKIADLRAALDLFGGAFAPAISVTPDALTLPQLPSAKGAVAARKRRKA